MLRGLGTFLMRNLIVVGLIALACSGCTHTSGHDFIKPSAAHLVVGKTTKNEIYAAYGAPQREATTVTSGDDVAAKQIKSEFEPAPVPGTDLTYFYDFVENSAPVWTVTISVKAATFQFHDGILVSYSFSSSFAADSSNFDEGKLSQIQKSKSTEADVKQLLGPPSGEAVYPAVLTPGNRRVVYSYATFDQPTRKAAAKNLVVLFDKDGRVLDYKYSSGSSDVPVGGGWWIHDLRGARGGSSQIAGIDLNGRFAAAMSFTGFCRGCD